MQTRAPTETRAARRIRSIRLIRKLHMATHLPLKLCFGFAQRQRKGSGADHEKVRVGKEWQPVGESNPCDKTENLAS
jgi:hypothetical protein